MMPSDTPVRRPDTGPRSDGGQPAPARPALRDPRAALTGTAVRTAAWLLPLVVIGTPAIHARLPSRLAEVVQSVKEQKLSEGDAALLHRGYYEDLVRVDRLDGELFQIYMKRPLHWVRLHETEAARKTNDFFTIELVPSVELRLPGLHLSTNRWGMRDRDYELAKPPGVHRIALLGSSHVIGSGVKDHQVFEAVLEERLNQEAGDGGRRYEILNFGVESHTPLESLAVLEKKASAFAPDAVFFVAHAIDRVQVVTRLVADLRLGIEIPYAYLRELAARAGVDGQMAEVVGKRKLEPFGEELLSWVYRGIVAESRRLGASPVWIFLPRIKERVPEGEVERLERLAREAGFALVSLAGLYDGLDTDPLRIAEWDYHPNHRGHRLIAERLHELLRERGLLASTIRESRRQGPSAATRARSREARRAAAPRTASGGAAV